MPKTFTPKWKAFLNIGQSSFQDNSPVDPKTKIIYYKHTATETLKIELNLESSNLIRNKIAELEELLTVETSLTGKVIERTTLQSVVSPSKTSDEWLPAPIDPVDE